MCWAKEVIAPKVKLFFEEIIISIFFVYPTSHDKHLNYYISEPYINWIIYKTQL